MFLRNGSFLTAAALTLLAGVFVAPAHANSITFFQFQGDPDLNVGQPSPKEFVYNATTGLSAGPGAVGNENSPFNFFAPGLFGIITGGLPGVTQTPPGIGTAPFYLLADLTLVLNGFAPVNSADVVTGSISQALGAGSFQILHSAFDKPLLAGEVSSGLITVKKSTSGTGPGDNASVLAGVVTYTDSILEDSFLSAGFSNTGSFSFALTGLTGTYGTTLVNGEHRLSNFAADGTGSFDANPLPAIVPAPASVWGGATLIGFLGLARAKKRRQMAI